MPPGAAESDDEDASLNLDEIVANANIVTDTAWYIRVRLNNIEALAFLDDGSEVSIISPAAVAKFSLSGPRPSRLAIKTVDASRATVKGETRADIEIDGKTTSCDLLIVDGFEKDILLGRAFQETADIEIMRDHHMVRAAHAYFGKNGTRIEFPCLGSTLTNTTIDPAESKDIICECSMERGSYWVEPTPFMSQKQLIIESSILRVEKNTVTVTCENRSVLAQSIAKGEPVIMLKPPIVPRPINDPRNYVYDLSTYEEEHLCAACDERASTGKPVDSELATLIEGCIKRCTEPLKSRLRAILEVHQKILSRHRFDLGLLKDYEMVIDTGDAEPICKLPWRVSPAASEASKEITDEMCRYGLLEPAEQSNWSSPTVLVKKPDNTFRMCQDFRALNAVTKKDRFPLPRIEVLLDALNGATIFGVIDLTSGFWQIGLSKASREKTAFVTPHGAFQYTRMSMGICNGPATFQKCMARTLKHLLFKCCLVYIDDILVFARSEEEFPEAVNKVLTALSDNGLKIKPQKTELGLREVLYLGHRVSAEGKKSDPKKIEAVLAIKPPKDVKDLYVFLGMAQYFRKFIEHFACIAAPLYSLLKKDTPFIWSDTAMNAFNTLKRALTTAPVIAHPDNSKEYILATDACQSGLGAVLKQLDENQCERVIAYASRTLTPVEKRYSATDLELLAVKFGVEEFRPYISDSPFKLVTDHKSLLGTKWLNEKKDPTGRRTRWLQTIHEYNFTYEYKPGKKHQDADALSRLATARSEMKDAEVALIELTSDLIEKLKDGMPLLHQEDWVKRIILNYEFEDNSWSNRERGEKFTFADGYLWRTMNTWPSERRPQVCVPRLFRTEIMMTCHDCKSHVGTRRCYEFIRDYFFWPRMSNDVKTYIRTCHFCQAMKVDQQKPIGYLSSAPIPRRPFEHIHVDFAGPLKMTYNKMRYYILAIDRLTKYAIGKATMSNEMRVASQFIEDINLRFGPVRRITTDNGSEFIGKDFKEILARNKIEHHLTSPGRPAGNGQVERLNHTIKDYIAARINEENGWWHEKLPYAIADYNTTVHDATNYTPHYLLYGYTYEDVSSPPLPESAYTERTQQLEQITKVREKIHQQLQKRHQIMAERYNQRRRTYLFKAGDLVMVEPSTRVKEGVTTKLNRRYIGPFKVVDKVGPNSYLVLRANIKVKYNADQMKLYLEREEQPFTDSQATIFPYCIFPDCTRTEIVSWLTVEGNLV